MTPEEPCERSEKLAPYVGGKGIVAESASRKFTIRKQRLCCLLNPAFECGECGAKICNPCNNADLEIDPTDDGHGIERMGHTKKKCGKHPKDLDKDESVWIVL